MMKLASMTAVGLALLAMGCQAQRPPETPQAAAQPPPPPGPPHGGPMGGPGMMGRHHPGVAGPWGQGEGREAGLPPGHGESGRPDRPRRGKRAKGMGQGQGPMGPGGGPMMGQSMGHGGGHEVMRELAMLGVRFYPPPLLMRRAKDIGLTPDQVSKIRQEMFTAHGKSIDYHAKIEHSKIEVARLLAADKVDERALNAQIDEAAKAQAEMHKLHVGAMVRVRALLTAEQRQKLDERKAKPQAREPHHGPGPVGPVSADDDDDDDDNDDDDAES